MTDLAAKMEEYLVYVIIIQPGRIFYVYKQAVNFIAVIDISRLRILNWCKWSKDWPYVYFVDMAKFMMLSKSNGTFSASVYQGCRRRTESS